MFDDLWWRTKSRASDVYYWFVHRLVKQHRYHLLDTGLPPGYYDPCVRIPRALFLETQRFVKITKGVIDWDYDDEHSAAWKAFTDAVAWFEAHPNFDEGCANWEQEKTLDEEKNRHLLNIIKHLDHMWYP